jgi:hypothetical protein
VTSQLGDLTTTDDAASNDGKWPRRVELHVNSLEQYRTAAQPEAATAAAAAAAPPTAAQPEAKSSLAGRDTDSSRQGLGSAYRPAKDFVPNKKTPFEAPQNFLLLAECGAEVQAAEEAAQREGHRQLAMENWSFTIPQHRSSSLA